MKKQKNILRFSGLVLLFSVLFTHVFSREFFSVSPVAQGVQQQNTSEQLQKVDAQEKSAEGEQEDQASISQLTFEVVVPSYAFDFGVPFVLLFTPGFEFLLSEEPLAGLDSPTIIDSYFEKLFEHHIAINAP